MIDFIRAKLRIRQDTRCENCIISVLSSTVLAFVWNLTNVVPTFFVMLTNLTFMFSVVRFSAV